MRAVALRMYHSRIKGCRYDGQAIISAQGTVVFSLLICVRALPAFICSPSAPIVILLGPANTQADYAKDRQNRQFCPVPHRIHSDADPRLRADYGCSTTAARSG